MASRDDRHWVYHRAGLPCRVCGTAIVVEEMAARKLYWCPKCQALTRDVVGWIACARIRASR